MSENYSPDPGVKPQSPYNTVFLSQRDLSLTIPVNFVTIAGVSFSAACFPTQKYEDDSSGDCLSNLLAVGFRRFVIDLYWDESRQVWSFCPVTIQTSASSSAPPPTPTGSLSLNSRATLASSAEISSASRVINARQVTPTTGSNPSPTISRSVSGLSSASGSILGMSLPTVSVLPDSPNQPLISIGPYLCTTTINLSTFTSQLLDFIQKTQNTLEAHILYVIINIHAAASGKSPTAPAPAPTSLPGPSNLIGSLFSGNLSTYMYTQSDLTSDRANLNASWYTVNENYRPDDSYYTTTINEYNIVSTEDGWPSESYIEFSKSKRLLLGWGSIDPQMSGYNFSGDSSIIFPSDFIQQPQTDISADKEDGLTSGCFLHDITADLSLKEVNSSWAVETTVPKFDYPTSTSSDSIPLLNLTTNTTNCGISPVLNVTLLNATAHDNYIPYQNFSYATIWSWAYGEPKNYSSSGSGSSLFSCATSNLDLGGRWVVADCSQRYYASCRAQNQPYNWTLTTYPISYSYAASACPDSYDFAAPRTALENSYLTQAMRASSRDYDGHGAWVDFNSLNVQGCWVTGGPNATCPYSDSLVMEDDVKKRVVLVPTIAAIIVLIVTALTGFVKMAGNRRGTKRARRRRTRENGFIYEGVPS